MINQYRENYRRINNSSQNTELIYPLSNRGFFSEINNLALAVLFCLENKINLKIYSKNWVGGKWEDYFNPVLQEYNGFVPIPSDIFSIRREDKFYAFYHKSIKKRKILQDSIWTEMRSKPFIDTNFYYPELGIKGGIFEAKKQVFDLILDYNKRTEQEVFFVDNANPEFIKNSCGIQVRRGDKVNGKNREAESFDVQLYINKILEINTSIKNITICTDDYRVLKDFQKQFPEFHYLSLCDPSRIGYFQREYNNTTDDSKIRDEVINVLKDANLLINSKMFIGTYSSNIARFVVLMRNNKDCYSLDIDWTPL
ncbi:O-fucosyltransferase family protein [Flavobacterium crocinum]|uniref:hypothetical protein n=1 Tax=Flavobacterium crocinum TaxID=2183896 RepID=UPI0011B21504|nr:hypothetical protein [Flavobacterium crocinum]